MLEVTNSVLDETTPEDRYLIALIAKDDNLRRKLSDRERQRLHRVRQKLKRKIALHFGVDVAELLRGPL